jgi:hypothetical protein
MKTSLDKYALIIALLLLTACSGTTFVYNRLDFLLPWYLNDYVDLDRSQKDNLDELLHPYLQWHRSEELPQYLKILDQIEQSLDRTMQPEDVADIAEAFEDAWSRLENEGLKWMLALGASLSDEQIAEFLQELQEQQEEYEEKYLTRDEGEFREEAYDSMMDGFQDYLGKLDATQKEVLLSTAAAMQRSDTAWLEERAAWLVKLGTLLQREPGWQLRLKRALDAREENHSPAYRQVYGHNVKQIQIAVATVLNSRSEKQNRRLRKKLNNFREDIQTLVEQGRDRETGARAGA